MTIALGPGAIVAAAFIGPGTIATAAAAGCELGYRVAVGDSALGDYYPDIARAFGAQRAREPTATLQHLFVSWASASGGAERSLF